MKEYIVKRVFLAVVTIFVISAITFFAMNLIPGGPFNTEKALSPAVQKTLEDMVSSAWNYEHKNI